MKKLILSLAFTGTVMVAISACNSTKNVSGTTDSTVVDSTITTAPVDTAATIDTMRTMPADTTMAPVQ